MCDYDEKQKVFYVFFLSLDRKESFDLRQYKSFQKRKFHRFREGKTYSVENIFCVADSSSQTVKNYESRTAQNTGCNKADWPAEAILGTVKCTHANLGAGKTSKSQPLGD